MNYDELKKQYNDQINSTKSSMQNLETEKQNDLNAAQNNYNDQLNKYNELQQQQEDYINQWSQTQKEQTQKQTDYELGLIEQSRQKAKESNVAEKKDAYTDYQRQASGNAENMASNGLQNTGYSESSKVSMYNTYQNRVSTANKALSDANVQFDNQMQQALLNNDAKLAETALQELQMQYQLALSGFEYTTNLYNEYQNNLNNIKDRYFQMNSTYQNRLDNYYSQLQSVKQQETAYKQWQAELAEQQRQFNEQMNYQKQQNSIDSIYNDGYAYSDSTSNSNSSTSSYSNSSKSNSTPINSSAKNGPMVLPGSNTKLKAQGSTVGELFGKGTVKGSDGSNIDSLKVLMVPNYKYVYYDEKGKPYNSHMYYIWDNATGKYVDVTNQVHKVLKNS